MTTAHPIDDARINEDRECPDCGYNLRGLQRGGNCPECGRKIGGKVSTVRRDNIAYAAPTYLRTLRTGLWIMASSLLLMWAGPLGSMVWAFGAWFALTKRPMPEGASRDPVLDNEKLRAVARWMQVPAIAGWGLLALASAATPAGGAPNFFVAALAAMGAGALIISMVAYIPLGVYLSAIADWAAYDSAAARLRGSAWFMCVLGTGMAVCFVVPVLRFFGVWLTVAWVVAVIVFLITVLQLAYAIHWAVKNQRYAEGSVARVAAKQAKRLAAPSVVHDMDCRRCGYDLEGMPFGGVCPECGESYADATPLPIREVPKRSSEDEAPLPLAGEDGAAADKSIRFPTRFGSDQHAVGGQQPARRPAAPHPLTPKPLGANPPDEGDIPLAPEDLTR